MINHPNMLTSLLTEAVRASFHRGLNHCYGMSFDMQTVDCDVYLLAALLDGRFYSKMIS